MNTSTLPGVGVNQLQVCPTSSPLDDIPLNNERNDFPQIGLLVGVIGGVVVTLAVLLVITCVALVLLVRRQHKHLRITARHPQDEHYFSLSTYHLMTTTSSERIKNDLFKI